MRDRHDGFGVLLGLTIGFVLGISVVLMAAPAKAQNNNCRQ